MKIETTITLDETFDDELNEAYNNQTFEENEQVLRKYEEWIKQELEQKYDAKNVKVKAVFVQD